MERVINLPFTTEDLESIKTGDILYLNGTVYSARDAAHKRLCEQIEGGGEIPLDLKDAVIYYLGPTPARPGQVIGSAGPTTAGRMDKYTPTLLDLGMKGMIGKGRRSEDVRLSIIKNKAIYMGATGGAGALLSKCIVESETIAYDDLGTEALRRIEVTDFPAFVAIDATGATLY